MKSIYILLTKSDTWVSKAIKLLTDDRYTHVSISFEKALQPLYSFSRKYTNLPLPAGLQNESFTNGFFKKYSYIPCAVYELKVSDKVYWEARNEVETMMKDAPNYRFSVLGLILCKLNIPMHRKSRYFCSEFVSEILVRSKALSLPKQPSLMRPNDYTKLSALSCCYEGKLKFLLQNGLVTFGGVL